MEELLGPDRPIPSVDPSARAAAALDRVRTIERVRTTGSPSRADPATSILARFHAGGVATASVAGRNARRVPRDGAHPPGLPARLRPAAVRVSPGPIPMPAMRMGRGPVRRGPLHLHPLRPRLLGPRLHRALRDEVDHRIEVIRLNLDEQIAER